MPASSSTDLLLEGLFKVPELTLLHSWDGLSVVFSSLPCLAGCCPWCISHALPGLKLLTG